MKSCFNCGFSDKCIRCRADSATAPEAVHSQHKCFYAYIALICKQQFPISYRPQFLSDSYLNHVTEKQEECTNAGITDVQQLLLTHKAAEKVSKCQCKCQCMQKTILYTSKVWIAFCKTAGIIGKHYVTLLPFQTRMSPRGSTDLKGKDFAREF